MRRASASRLIGASLALSLAWPASAVAAPPAEEDEAPAFDPEIIDKVTSLVDEGQARFDRSDYVGAVELWVEAFDALPSDPTYDPQRAFLRLVLANGYKKAYRVDEDPQHLRKAQVLFEAHLEWLDPSDTATIALLQTELDEIVSTLERIERERIERERELAEAERKAHEQAVLQAELERAAQLERERAARDARKYRLFTGIGGTCVGLGAVAAGLMVAGLSLGQKLDNEGTELIADLDEDDDEDDIAEAYADAAALLDPGIGHNQMAWASGITAGVLLASGVALISVATVKWKPSHDSPREHKGRAQLEPRLGGLALRF